MFRFFLFSLLLPALIVRVAPANAAPPETDIFSALEEGDAAVVRRLVSENPDAVHARDALHRTPLHFTAETGDRESAQALLDAGADLSARSSKDATPLHLAAWKGNRQMVEFLLARGADIQATDYYGRTPLSWALLGGEFDMAFFLEPLTPRLDIFAASCFGKRQTIKTWLRENPALLHHTDEAGQTPLHWAVQGWQQAKTVELLLVRGADLSARNRAGETPLMLAERTGQDKTLAVMHRAMRRRQKQSWAWALGITAVFAGGRFYVNRRRAGQEKARQPSVV